jgi:IS1 family transposase
MPLIVETPVARIQFYVRWTLFLCLGVIVVLGYPSECRKCEVHKINERGVMFLPFVFVSHYIAIINGDAKCTARKSCGSSWRQILQSEQILQTEVISKLKGLPPPNEYVRIFAKVGSHLFLGEWSTLREKAMPNVVTEHLRRSFSLIGNNERILSDADNVSGCKVGMNPCSLAGYQGFGVLFRSNRVGVSRLNGTPKINNLKRADENKKSCGKHQGLIPTVLVRVDRNLGQLSDSHSLLLIATSYGATIILICLGCAGPRRPRGLLIALGVLCDLFGTFALGAPWSDESKGTEDCDQSDYRQFHSTHNVTQKLLTAPEYCNTLIAIGRTHMANVLSIDKQIAVISALAEGAGIRQIERMTGVHRDTIMRLGVRTGKGCAKLLDSKMRNLSCRQLQFDEIWGFIGKKERHCSVDDSPELGDVWTFCAIDADTKLVPSFRVGKRDSVTANDFVSDVAGRLRNRVQISSDALRAYVDAVELAFGANVDFAQIVKTYVTDDSIVPERKFSAPEIVITEKRPVSGFPDMRLASTSHIERLNGTTRLHMRRLTRLTYAFSKKRENFEAAVALHFAYYNFVKRHITLRATPAMAAGIERDFWTVGDLVEAAA